MPTTRQPARKRRRTYPAVSADPRGGSRLRSPLPGAGRLRGRRPDRHLRAARRRGQGDHYHRLLRQGPDAAGRQRRLHVRHHEGPAHRAGGGDGEVRRRARQGDRGAGADRQFIRQRARRARHRREDRGAIDQRIRRSGHAAQARRRDQAGQTPAVADRQCRDRAHVEAPGHARPERPARRAGGRARRARAGLQALVAFLKAMEFSTITRRVAEKTGIDASAVEADAKLSSVISPACGGEPALGLRPGQGEPANSLRSRPNPPPQAGNGAQAQCRAR